VNAFQRGTVLAVTGLAIEARIARGPGVRCVTGRDGLRALVSVLADRANGVCAIMSFGIAGGLDERLPPGTVIAARSVIAQHGSWKTDADWTAALLRRVPAALHADVAATDLPVDEPDLKQRLRCDTGAVAVDTESHVAARAAAEHELPFAVFRVISDPARRALPSVALVALRADGRVNLTAVLRAIGRAPAELPLLLRSAADARIALRALARGRESLGAPLAYPDLSQFLLDVS
jgi:adenosylhomocysteine nucleosidase